MVKTITLRLRKMVCTWRKQPFSNPVYFVFNEHLAQSQPGDIKHEMTGGSCQIEIYSTETTKFLTNYNLLCFQISVRLIIFFTKHDYQAS